MEFHFIGTESPQETALSYFGGSLSAGDGCGFGDGWGNGFGDGHDDCQFRPPGDEYRNENRDGQGGGIGDGFNLRYGNNEGGGMSAMLL
jgi:hypothetical protein